jgi:hypothetical protein
MLTPGPWHGHCSRWGMTKKASHIGDVSLSDAVQTFAQQALADGCPPAGTLRNDTSLKEANMQGRTLKVRQVYAELRRALGSEVPSGDLLRLASKLVDDTGPQPDHGGNRIMGSQPAFDQLPVDQVFADGALWRVSVVGRPRFTGMMIPASPSPRRIQGRWSLPHDVYQTRPRFGGPRAFAQRKTHYTTRSDRALRRSGSDEADQRHEKAGLDRSFGTRLRYAASMSTRFFNRPRTCRSRRFSSWSTG